MRRLLFVFLVGAFTLSTVRAQELRLSLSPQGVAVNAGTLGTLTLPVPSIETVDHKELAPAATLDSSGGIRATYPNGFVLKISLSPDDRRTITYRFDSAPADAANFKISTLLPINFNQGGRFALGDHTGEFPATHSGQMIAAGDANQFDIIHPLGEALRFKTPAAYQQLQDNRTWNWNIFSWIYRYDLKRYRDKTSFSITVSVPPSATPAAGAPRFILDRFGQVARKDYPGKIRTEEELKADLASTAVTYDGPPLDRFGGLAQSGQMLGLTKSGFFHTAVVGENRHVLVTPDGNAFFQLGVCGIANTDDYTTVKGREKIYEWVPDTRDPAWLTAWRNEKPSWGVFSFQIANWIRKNGRPYSYEEWTGQAVTRLRAWGFNSSGAFSNYSATMRERGFPYVSFLPKGKAEGVTYLPDRVGADEVMDPFAVGAEDALGKAFAGPLAAQAADPLLIGYFLGNEQHFETLPKLIPAYKGTQVAAKARLVALLRERYPDIAAFNTAWSVAKPFTSFDQLADEPLFARTEAATADLRAFLRLYLETYYGMIRRVFKKYDANHLLLGSRLTPHTALDEDVVTIGARHVDVVSINYYSYRIDRAFLQKIHGWSGRRPLLLSEWYFSATDHGLGGGQEVRDQTERGNAYRNYVEQAAATGWVVGSQWFIYADQSATGRFFEGFNGEGANTGLIDVTDRPYEPLIAAARQTHSQIYRVFLGKTPPFSYEEGRFAPKK